MTSSILVLNAGSSSLKFGLFRALGGSGAGVEATAHGAVDDLEETPHFRAFDQDGSVLADRTWPPGQRDGFDTILAALLAFADAHLGQDGLAAVGHRIVHGGAAHVGPVLVTPPVMAELEALIPLDPLHLPHNLAPIHALAAARPDLPQVACFDTAFHHTLPPVARRFGLPLALEAAGVRRYGFHGLSYEYIAGELARQRPDLAHGRVIVAHLGSGASLCALADGRSIATTMGLTPLDGLVMATRCGSLDPGVLLYLGRQGHSFADIEDMLYHRSGLLGVSGISADIRDLLASDDKRAQDAIELFTYRIATEIGGLVSALGGLDGLVFTAGIGEHAPAVRAAVCARLAWLGIRLDDAANFAGAALISLPGSAVEVRVMATGEEAMIARHTLTTLGRGRPVAAGAV
ncbi:acetate/propionate family kinase [Lichenicola sp.]|uniref:acetate/propionate family kinase n=1 Tax=Lichenicola sp. TaxID=2804529 RepID=UPI003B00EBE0